MNCWQNMARRCFPAELTCRAVRRPELNYKMLAEVDPKRPKLPEDVQEQVNINIKYDGYIKRQMKQVEQFKKMEEKKIPENINYDEIQSLRIEAKQKLNLYRPINIGQASVFRAFPRRIFRFCWCIWDINKGQICMPELRSYAAKQQVLSRCVNRNKKCSGHLEE